MRPRKLECEFYPDGQHRPIWPCTTHTTTPETLAGYFCKHCHMPGDHPKFYVTPGQHECRGLYTTNGTTWSDVKAWVDEGEFWCDECCLRYLVPPPPPTDHKPWCPHMGKPCTTTTCS